MRDAAINLRARPEQRDLIDQAAELLGKSRSDFMLEAACDKAQSVLLDQAFFRLDADKLRQYQLINQWHVAQYGYLLRKLKGLSEGDSNLLENSMVLFGSALHDGDRHAPHNLPLVLGGGGGGRVIGGQHLEYTEDSPLANLYVSMLDAFGAPVERFADSTGPLAGLMHT